MTVPRNKINNTFFKIIYKIEVEEAIFLLFLFMPCWVLNDKVL